MHLFTLEWLKAATASGIENYIEQLYSEDFIEDIQDWLDEEVRHKVRPSEKRYDWIDDAENHEEAVNTPHTDVQKATWKQMKDPLTARTIVMFEMYSQNIDSMDAIHEQIKIKIKVRLDLELKLNDLWFDLNEFGIKTSKDMCDLGNDFDDKYC